LQKTLITAVSTAAVLIAIYEARQASTFRNQVNTLQQQQTALTEQIDRDREEAVRQLSALGRENERLKLDTAELLKLRGDVTRLRQELAANKRVTPARPPLSEYVYQGKTLSDWVRDLYSTNQPVRQAAHDEFTAMGADALTSHSQPRSDSADLTSAECSGLGLGAYRLQCPADID